MLPLAITTCKDAPTALVRFRYKDTDASATTLQAADTEASTSRQIVMLEREMPSFLSGLPSQTEVERLMTVFSWCNYY